MVFIYARNRLFNKRPGATSKGSRSLGLFILYRTESRVNLGYVEGLEVLPLWCEEITRWYSSP